MMNIREAQLKAIQKLKDKGVTAIKLELEAQLNRGDYRDCEESCDNCDGDGWNDCNDCDGDGTFLCGVCDGSETVTTTVNGATLTVPCTNGCDSGYVNCEHCDDGRIECRYCDGHGELSSSSSSDEPWGDEQHCFDWLMNRIAERTGTNLNDNPEGEYELRNPFSWMSFAKFYNDGSVDSELTFTVKIDNPENVFYVPEVLGAWKDMADAMNEDMQVGGAGLHTALIWDANAHYPSRADDYNRSQEATSNRLPEQALRNFKKSMTQLLPALYFLGTTNEQSRGLRYRQPNVSVNYRQDNDYGRPSKYSAISYRYGAMEFRVFDTCYDNPDAILDNIVVISNSLKYLSETYISPRLDKFAAAIDFGNEANNNLERFYGTTTHLDILNAGLSRLKPSYYTIGQLKEQRQFKRTKTQLKSIRKDNHRKAQLAYQEYLERLEWEKKAVEIEAKGSYLRSIAKRMSLDKLRETSADLETQADQQAKDYLKTWLAQNFSSAEVYISRQVKKMESELQGQYRLDFN